MTSPSDARSRRSVVGAAAVALALAALAFWRIRDFAFLGHDTLPILAASRIGSLLDVIATLGDQLMGGRMAADFYRPVLNLSFALDHALFGLDPVGFQLTNALVFGAAAFGVFCMARALVSLRSGTSGDLAGWIALGVFAFHPAVVEVLPSPARRPELLVCLFMSSALALQLSARGLPRWPRLVAIGLLSLLAMSSKETALLSMPVVGITAAVLRAASLASEERRQAVGDDVLAYGVSAVVAVVARLAVLGSIGGHGAVVRASLPADSLAAVAAVLRGWMTPLPVVAGAWTLPLLLVLVVTAALGVTAWRVIGANATASGGPPSTVDAGGLMGPVQLAAVGFAWLAGAAGASALAGGFMPWYALIGIVGWALLVASASVMFATGWRRRGGTRLLAAGGAIGLCALVGWQSLYSPLVRPYPEWDLAAAESQRFRVELLRRVRDAGSDVAAIEAPPLPLWVTPKRDDPTVWGAAVLSPHAVEAWLELELAPRPVRVVVALELPRGNDTLDIADDRDEDETLVVVITRWREGLAHGFPSPAELVGAQRGR